MSGTTHADIPLSFLEHRAVYSEPMLQVQRLYSDVSQAVFQAFRDWNVALENVSYKQTPVNLAEVSVAFALLGGRLGFTVGLASASLLVKDPSWSEADLVTSIAKAGIGAVVQSGAVTVAQQRSTIAMHVKPVSGQIKEFVAGLIRPSEPALTAEDVRAYGFSMYRQDSSWVVDTSASYPDALFVRIERVSGPNVSFEQIASTLRQDESTLLGLLRLDVD